MGPRAAAAPSPRPRPEPDLRIGRRLRAARKRRGLAIAELAAATGLTKGFVSQVERDLAAPSVASLVRICGALQIGVGSLFEPSTTALVRATERPRINFGGEAVAEWLLTPAQQDRLQVIESRIEPGGGGGRELYSLPAEAEFVHVVAGALEVRFEHESYRLDAGDSLTFSAREPHTWLNPSQEEPALVLWVITPPVA